MTSPSDAATVTTRSVDLGGGRLLFASRFTDPATGRNRVTLVKGWADGSPLPPTPDGDVVELPGEALAPLLEALSELEDS